LRWGQARELFKLGQEEPATQTMVSILRANMGHRHANLWIDELTGLLKREQEPAAVTHVKPDSDDPAEPEKLEEIVPEPPRAERPPGTRPPGGGRPR